MSHPIPRLRPGRLMGAVTAAVLLLPIALPAASETARPLTVAFIGDQGSGKNARAVLEMIKRQGADVVLHQGDLGYSEDTATWDAMITEILGLNFPYFASVGNHDDDHWYGKDGYQEILRARLDRIGGASCTGDLGVKSACTYKGLFFILSGAGTIPDDSPDVPNHVTFIRDQLARIDAPWRICSWHKNQKKMQVGGKRDEVGWGPYEACREGGAIVATAHEHSYSRTHLMDSFEAQRIASTSNTLRIERGKSFAFVSGLGGYSIRGQRRDGAWWASIYTEDQGADYGALFCTFNVDGDPTRARCHFRDISDRVPDRFEIISAVKGGGETLSPLDSARDQSSALVKADAGS